MPYINQENRTELNATIDELAAIINHLGGSTAGNLNYTITRLFLLTILQEVRYDNINTAYGILEGVKQEMARALAGPYEQQKQYDNGQVVEGVM